jgi:hypothetical protein
MPAIFFSVNYLIINMFNLFRLSHFKNGTNGSATILPS